MRRITVDRSYCHDEASLLDWHHRPICGVGVIASGARDEGGMPDLNGAVAWLNSPPLSTKALRGKVVLVNFWTYCASIVCANCRT